MLAVSLRSSVQSAIQSSCHFLTASAVSQSRTQNPCLALAAQSVRAVVRGRATAAATLHTASSICVQQSRSACLLDSTSTLQALCLAQRTARPWAALPQLSRQQRHSSSFSKWQQQVQAKTRSLIAAPQQAARTTKAQLTRLGENTYDKLPTQGRKLIDSLTKPGNTRKVISLQFEAFWAAHGNKVLAAGAVVAIYFLWRGMFGLTSMMFNLSETMAETGFLALAAAMAAFAYLYLRRRWTVNPDSVYRLALRRLNTDAGVLEVLGAPVAGSDVRASVTTGGGLRLRGLVPALRTRRLQMIFPLTGADRRGLVSLEAKKRKGRYQFKLLAVDVPTAEGKEQRVYLEGDVRAYDRGGVIRELRDPFLNALAMKATYEEEDEVDDAVEDAEHEQHDREAAAAAVRPLRPHASQKQVAASGTAGGQMYVLDRVGSTVSRAWQSIRSLVPGTSSTLSADQKSQQPAAAPLAPAAPGMGASKPLAPANQAQGTSAPLAPATAAQAASDDPVKA